MKFATVVADPPWPYGDAGLARSVIPKPIEDVGQQRVNDLAYSTMTVADISGLPVQSAVADNAHLYLWTTNAFMVEAHEVARAWGFTPKTIITWVKTRQADGQPSMKTGYYFRGATEHVVFAVRGSLKLRGNIGRPTAFLHPRLAQHSAKPQAFYDIVKAASPGPRLEMFARTRRPGFFAWGDQSGVERDYLFGT